jgi:hypothetical protein
MFFLPKGVNNDQVIHFLVKDLALSKIDIPTDVELGYQFLARKGEGMSILEIECRDNARDIIEELSEWENPSKEYKNLLLGCRSCIKLYYRDEENARSYIKSMASVLGQMAVSCVVENGEGCLLLLSDILSSLSKDEAWSWERREFPELPNVAISEWREIS